jgi:hypothetical protein
MSKVQVVGIEVFGRGSFRLPQGSKPLLRLIFVDWWV